MSDLTPPPPSQTLKCTGSDQTSARRLALRRQFGLAWPTWIVAFSLTTCAGMVLVPFFRQSPESLHTFAQTLNSWQRKLLLLTASFSLVTLGLSVLRPRLSHLRHFAVSPPMWSAVILGLVTIAIYDVGYRLSPHGYIATYWDWALYLGLPLILVGAARMALRLQSSSALWKEPRRISESKEVDQKSLESWPTLQRWLDADVPADHDFFGHRVISEQLRTQLLDGRRAIGIIGRFGTGKSSTVNWALENRGNLIPCVHKCWGFDSSEAAIGNILTEALNAVGAHVDTFTINSLPQSYRRSIGAAGGLWDSFSHLLFRQDDPADHFKRLSSILDYLDRRLVLVIEDIDRSDTSGFEIQEIVAFLERLKTYPRISFVLTGDARPEIDFARLCDHVLYVSELSASDVAGVISEFRKHCLNVENFPRTPIDDENEVFSETRYGLIQNLTHDVYPPDAVARLLATPRALRHALSRTLMVWEGLCGEVNWDHLLTLNVLHFAAPGAFDFLCRRWADLRREPSPSGEGELRDGAVRALMKEWDDATRSVDWSVESAKVLINALLPTAPLWLGGSRGYERDQGVEQGRYWHRAINEVIPVNGVRDQEVLSDIIKWKASAPAAATAMLDKIVSNYEYAITWERFAFRFVGGNEDRIRQVISELIVKSASLRGNNTLLFEDAGRTACGVATNIQKSEANVGWIGELIEKTLPVSLLLAVQIHGRFVESHEGRLVPDSRLDELRDNFHSLCKKFIVDAESLEAVLPTKHVSCLFKLFNKGPLGGPERFQWMCPLVRDGLCEGRVSVAVNVLGIIEEHAPSKKAVRSALVTMFGDFAHDAVGALSTICRSPNLDESEWALNQLSLAVQSLKEEEERQTELTAGSS